MPLPFLNNLDSLATLGTGIFAGTAFYMTSQEVPALRDLGLDEHWRFFPHMYHRAFAYQGLVNGAASVAAIVHGLRITNSDFDRKLWIGAGAAFLALWPYTLLVMVPTNNQIVDDNKKMTQGVPSSVEPARRKEMLEKWNCMHAVRTAVGMGAFGLMIYGLARHASLVFKQ
ncbi:uncharacterized protein LOC129586523 [Paramacrobiotus metropolitanus]|uniref:uncharacterized protein LOC129586523 n=1 Tax=Paramacrobiotus metropolitanus TaxID=2943436 RepID=UPI0024457BC9|nr:uncharacterized protein LOC129586523 [Paramacrobiotus metropolitanus]